MSSLATHVLVDLVIFDDSVCNPPVQVISLVDRAAYDAVMSGRSAFDHSESTAVRDMVNTDEFIYTGSKARIFHFDFFRKHLQCEVVHLSVKSADLK